MFSLGWLIDACPGRTKIFGSTSKRTEPDFSTCSGERLGALLGAGESKTEACAGCCVPTFEQSLKPELN